MGMGIFSVKAESLDDFVELIRARGGQEVVGRSCIELPAMDLVINLFSYLLPGSGPESCSLSSRYVPQIELKSKPSGSKTIRYVESFPNDSINISDSLYSHQGKFLVMRTLLTLDDRLSYVSRKLPWVRVRLIVDKNEISPSKYDELLLTASKHGLAPFSV
jgi:hypothetical protein